MTAVQWERVKEVFLQALALDGAERTSFLEQACGDNDALRAEVEALLESHSAAGDFLEAPAVAYVGVPTLPTAVGRHIGPFLVLEEIGRGGMGAVYRARREGVEYAQEVALKIVPPGPASAQIAARFRQERRILATLEHPNIARLIDGGNTDDGLPYFAMEFVDGEPIDVFCSTHNLDLRERLKLFRAVCDGVAYANRMLVVHRDLKPTNILVARDGSPKLLDFGIAKLLSSEDTDGAPLTQTGFGVMTPEYASPEQVRGEPITTATDVYALGVLLYQLLAGNRPYEVSRTNVEHAARVICEHEPKPPSAVAKRGGPWRISPDLDTIVLKALKKEPERRYPTAAELSDDIRRYLVGLPVQARADTVAYRFARFVARHRAAVAAATLAFVFLAVGLVATLYQARVAEANRRRAEQRFAEVRQIANSLVFELHNAIADIPGATKARALLLKRGSALLDTLARDAPSDPVLAEEVASAYHRLGDVLWTGGESNVGEREASIAAHRKALAIRQELARQSPADLDRQDRLASSDINLSYALVNSNDALTLARAAVALAVRNTALQPGNATYQRRLANARFAEATQLVALGRTDEAISAFVAVAAVYEDQLRRQPGDVSMMRNVTLTHKRIGALLVALDRYPEALEHYRRAVAEDETRVAGEPTSVEAKYDLSVSLNDLGVALGRSGDPAGQLEQCARALAVREDLAKADPANRQVQMGIVSTLTRMSRAYQLLHRYGDALQVATRGWTLAQQLGGTVAATTGVTHQLSTNYAALGRWEDAVKYARLALDDVIGGLAANPNEVWGQIDAAVAQVEFGEALAGRATAADRAPDASRRDWAQALVAFRAGLAGVAKLDQRQPKASVDPTLRTRAAAGVARAERALAK